MKRIQRQRKKGFKTPENTIYVGRPTKWGNPFKLSPDGWILYYKSRKLIGSHWCYWSATGGFKDKDVVELYSMWINGELKTTAPYLPNPPTIEEFNELKGKNLSCFCPLDKPCHVDVLIEICDKLSDKKG